MRERTVTRAQSSSSLRKAYVLLVFVGIWALMQGMTSIARAVEPRALREEL